MTAYSTAQDLFEINEPFHHHGLPAMDSFRVEPLQGHFEPEAMGLVGTQIMILNDKGEVFVGFNDPFFKEPIFKSADELDGVQPEAILSDYNYAMFLGQLRRTQKKAFKGAIFVQLNKAVDADTLTAADLLNADPSEIDFVMHPDHEEQPMVRKHRQTFFNAGLDGRLKAPLRKFVEATEALLEPAERLKLAGNRAVNRVERFIIRGN